jgi:hypothetical protein
MFCAALECRGVLIALDLPIPQVPAQGGIRHIRTAVRAAIGLQAV